MNTTRGVAGSKDRALPEAERQRLLLRLRADVQQAIAEIAAVRVELKLLVDLQEQRPLTAQEVERARTLNGENTRLGYQLRQFYAEFDALQRPG